MVHGLLNCSLAIPHGHTRLSHGVSSLSLGLPQGHGAEVHGTLLLSPGLPQEIVLKSIVHGTLKLALGPQNQCLSHVALILLTIVHSSDPLADHPTFYATSTAEGPFYSHKPPSSHIQQPKLPHFIKHACSPSSCCP
jgi:hypothetical protein